MWDLDAGLQRYFTFYSGERTIKIGAALPLLRFIKAWYPWICQRPCFTYFFHLWTKIWGRLTSFTCGFDIHDNLRERG